MSDKSKYHLKKIYKDTEVLFRSIIDAFFVFKILLILKNLFRLTNKSVNIMLTLQISTVKSNRGNFKRYRGS